MLRTNNTIAVFNPQTGKIFQIVDCQPKDAEKQHQAWPGADFVDVTGQHPNAHPNKHMIDLATRTLIPKIQSLEEAKSKKLKEMESCCFSAIVGGFTSGATGQQLNYPSADQDQSNLLHTAQVGGALYAESGDEWCLVEHTEEQAKAVLKDFVKHRDDARRRLAQIKAAMASAATVEQVAALTWV